MNAIGYDSTWFPLLDVGAFARDFPDVELHGANFFAIRSGARPSTATVLMSEADYRQMMGFFVPDQTAETEGYYPYAPYSAQKFTLRITAVDTFAGWNVVGATRIVQTAKTDGSSAVIVELADTRYFHGRYKVYYAENIYGPGLDVLTTTSQDWNDLIETRWNAAKTVGGNPGLNLSAWVDLASVPTEVPAGFDFRRNPVTVVEQIETLLNRCGYTLSHRSDGYLYAAKIGDGTLPTYPAAALWMSYQASDNQFNNRPSSYRFISPQLTTGQTVTVPGDLTAAPDIDGLGVKTIEYEFDPSGTAFARGVQDAWERRSHRRDDIYAGYVAASPVGPWHTSIVVWNRGFGMFTEIMSEPIPLMRAAWQFDGIPWSNTSNTGHNWRITAGTPSAGTFTLTIQKPDSSSVTTAAIAYSTGAGIASSIQTAINTLLGSGVATVSGTSYTVGGVSILWIVPGYTLTSSDISSFTGASAYAIAAATVTLRPVQKPTGVIVDVSTGLGLELYQTTGVSPSSKLKSYAASYFQSGHLVSSQAGGTAQTMGSGPKYFPGGVFFGRVAPLDDPAHVDDYLGSRTIYITDPTTADTVAAKDYQANLLNVALEDPGTFGPFGGTARFVGVDDGVADGSYWEWRAGEDPELGYSFSTDPVMRFASAEEDRADGDGFVRGGFVEIKGSQNTRFRVTRDGSGKTTYYRGAGVYDGIDLDFTDGPGGSVEVTGGIISKYTAPSTPPTAEPAATDLLTLLALTNQMRTVLISMGRLA